MKIDKVADFIISASDGYATDRQFFLYETELKTDGFEVYEGDGAEAYRLDELKGRTDLTDSAAHVFTMLGIL